MAIFKVKCSCEELWLREIYAHDQLLCNVDGNWNHQKKIKRYLTEREQHNK